MSAHTTVFSTPNQVTWMQRLYKPWETSDSLFGNLVVVGFLLVQVLDGALTYMGISIWGPGIEGNPLLSSAMAYAGTATSLAYAGTATSLAAAKSIAIGFGMVLHIYRVHTLVAALTLFYVAAAIIPWTTLLLTN